jgi:hypothetical protein
MTGTATTNKTKAANKISFPMDRCILLTINTLDGCLKTVALFFIAANLGWFFGFLWSRGILDVG